MQIFTINKPNSKHREGVLEGEGGALVVYTKAPAVENKANITAMKLIAEHFGVGRSKVRLVRGQTSKYKMFEVDDSSL